jgi:hypothetical protein
MKEIKIPILALVNSVLKSLLCYFISVVSILVKLQKDLNSASQKII